MNQFKQTAAVQQRGTSTQRQNPHSMPTSFDYHHGALLQRLRQLLKDPHHPRTASAAEVDVHQTFQAAGNSASCSEARQAAYSSAASMSARVRYGYSASDSSFELTPPNARKPVLTVTRVPRMHGLLPITCGLITIPSFTPEHYWTGFVGQSASAGNCLAASHLRSLRLGMAAVAQVSQPSISPNSSRQAKGVGRPRRQSPETKQACSRRRELADGKKMRCTEPEWPGPLICL